MSVKKDSQKSAESATKASIKSGPFTDEEIAKQMSSHLKKEDNSTNTFYSGSGG